MPQNLWEAVGPHYRGRPGKDKVGQWGHTYWCYTRYNAILALCVVDSKGHFRYIKTPVPGSLGDGHAWRFGSFRESLGRLKCRFQLIRNSRLSDPKFAGEVFMVCAALHNYLKRAGTPPPGRQQMQAHEPTTQDADVSYGHTYDNNRGPAEAASAMRSHLASHIASQLNLTPVTYEATTEYPTILHGPVVPAKQAQLRLKLPYLKLHSIVLN